MNESHATALQLLERHLATITTHPGDWYALFADDAVVEFPYAAGTAFEPLLVGKPAIQAYYERAATWFGHFTFRDIRFHAVGADLASCEVHGSATVAETGAPYEQDYVFVVEAKAGRIVRYREYWNPMLGVVAIGNHVAKGEP